MADIFLKTLPFFALIALGYSAARRGFFPPEATGYLTKFVFYFALAAMLFRFSANLSLAEVVDWPLVWAYLLGSLTVYLLATFVALVRKRGISEGAVEAQCAVIGNVGFLGIPMLILLLGERSVGPVMLVLAVDLIVFGSLIVILIAGARDGRMSLGILRNIAIGLVKNPMIVSMVLGLCWSATGQPLPAPMNEFLGILGAAATPCALFAIGASLADKSAERISVAGWLTFCKLVLHPVAVGALALFVFTVDPYSAAVVIATAALPVAGNVYIIARHYDVAPSRVSASIFVSTVVSVVSLSLVITWITKTLL
jgi:predicted permease